MRLCETLAVASGITSVVGSGGKTTLINRLAAELAERGRVILCTTTHILPPENIPFLAAENADIPLFAAAGADNLLCVGTRCGDGKIAAPHLPIAELTAQADFILCEADGARRLPAKAHLPHEPVIPPESTQTILVFGATAFGKPISDAAHRPDVFAALAESSVSDTITPARAAQVLQKENLYDKVFINQADDRPRMESARQLAALLPGPVSAGSLLKGEWTCLS